MRISRRSIATRVHRWPLTRPGYGDGNPATNGEYRLLQELPETPVIFDVRARSDAKSILVHLLNYTDYPSDDIALQVLGTWHRARLYTPEGPVRELPVYPVKDGTGIDISRIVVLGTVVVE